MVTVSITKRGWEKPNGQGRLSQEKQWDARESILHSTLHTLRSIWPFPAKVLVKLLTFVILTSQFQDFSPSGVTNTKCSLGFIYNIKLTISSSHSYGTPGLWEILGVLWTKFVWTCFIGFFLLPILNVSPPLHMTGYSLTLGIFCSGLSEKS